MKANNINKNEIARLIRKSRRGQATDQDIKMLDDYWDYAVSDTSILEKMSKNERKKLKNKMFRIIIQVRSGLK